MENNTVQEVKAKKKFLYRYKNNLACIQRLEEKLVLLDGKIKSIRSPNYSGMPRGSTPITVEDMIADKEELEIRIAQLKNKSKRIKREILQEIDTLEDTRYIDLLEAHFIECKTLETIAEDMGYTERYIYTLYKEAINKLIICS